MLTDARYRCPGQGYEISRAEHLARLADGYAGCDQCPHRAELGELPVSAARRLAVRVQPRPSLVAAEGIAGVAFNEFSPRDAERWCRAFGQLALERAPSPTIAIANDGRAVSPEFVSAAAQGLRWAGCGVIELSAATSAMLAWATRQGQATGTVLVGNPLGQTQTVGLRFWLQAADATDNGPRVVHPWSAPGSLERLAERVAANAPRPQRTTPAALRGPSDAGYLDELRPLYHGLRPLRFAFESASRPLARQLENLLAPTGCQMFSAAGPGAALHFQICVGADGETCHLRDEAGREVPPAALLALLARRCLADSPGATVVLGEDVAAAAGPAITAAGGKLVTSPATREGLSSAMTRTGAILGGMAGCVWFAGASSPDGLAVSSQLLSILSESDAPLSARLAAASAA